MKQSSFLERLFNKAEVEWKPLGEVLVRTTGTKITAKKMQDLNKNDAPIKIFAGGKTVAFVNFNDIPEKDIRKEPSIVVKSRGIIEFEYYDKYFSHKNEMWSYYSNNKNIDIKYIYYFLKNNEKYFQNLGSKMQMPQISTPDTDKYKIPIPCPADSEKSLWIQKEIVRILDSLTEKTQEIKKQLDTERKHHQNRYTYHRDKLFTFEDIEVEWKPLGEICHFKNGYTPSKSNKEYWENGTIPWFRMEDIRKNGRILSNSLQKISKSAVKGENLFPANSIIIATSATIGEHALITVPYLSNQRFTNLSIKAEYHTEIKIDFLFYYSFIISKWCHNNTTQSSFSSVDMGAFKKKLVPIPPLNEQKRIVDLLDRLTEKTTQITDTISKEIKLHQQRYEHYRNSLFDFPQSKEI